MRVPRVQVGGGRSSGVHRRVLRAGRADRNQVRQRRQPDSQVRDAVGHCREHRVQAVLRGDARAPDLGLSAAGVVRFPVVRTPPLGDGSHRGHTAGRPDHVHHGHQPVPVHVDVRRRVVDLVAVLRPGQPPDGGLRRRHPWPIPAQLDQHRGPGVRCVLQPALSGVLPDRVAVFPVLRPRHVCVRPARHVAERHHRVPAKNRRPLVPHGRE